MPTSTGSTTFRLHSRQALTTSPLSVNKKGFTLIELLVVISIIAILAVVGVTVFSGVQNSARQVKLKADFDSMYKNIEQKRHETGKVMGNITGSFWSDGSAGCTTGTNIYTSSICYEFLISQWAKITTAPLPKDPWGNYYAFDENEKESGSCASKDILKSAGPDHALDTGGDDTIFNPPFFDCPP